MGERSALVLAGAGSGKTRVLACRAVYLISQGYIPPDELMAVTFTNRAAREMQSRIASFLPDRPKPSWVGTFHGLSHRLLRRHHQAAGLPPSFVIMDTQDARGMLRAIAKEQNLDAERYSPQRLQGLIFRWKDQGWGPEEVAAEAKDQRLAEVFLAYEARKKSEVLVDFPDLLLLALKALEGPLASVFGGRFRHILIDEFQDTSPLQYRWLKAFCDASTLVFAVGDDDQSIYRFRGADPANMKSFLAEFGVEKVVRLEENYRSAKKILAVANALIAHNPGRLGKNLWTKGPEGDAVAVHVLGNEIEEAEFAVSFFSQAQKEGMPWGEMAALYRTNAQSRVLEHAFFRAGVPYRVWGGLRYFEREEVKTALAWLRLVANPMDFSAMTRALKTVEGVGAKSLGKVQAAVAEGVALDEAARILRGAQEKVLSAFLAKVRDMRLRFQEMSLAEGIAMILEASGLLAHYALEKERQENLRELVSAAVLFSQESETERAHGTKESDLLDFLSFSALEGEKTEEGTDAVRLMTVHAAKGLEFDAVLVTGMEDGLFPHENSQMEPKDKEEERRLLYVAITRAKRRLAFSLARERLLYGRTRRTQPSSFLGEIPSSLLRWRPFEGEKPQVTAQGARPRPLEASGDAFEVGKKVVHPRFGEGVVTSREGAGKEARVEVRFSTGAKWLALAFANLKAV